MITLTIRYKKTTFSGFRSEEKTFKNQKALDEFMDKASNDHSKEKIIGIS